VLDKVQEVVEAVAAKFACAVEHAILPAKIMALVQYKERGARYRKGSGCS